MRILPFFGRRLGVRVPHGAPNGNTHRKMGVFVCVRINKGTLTQRSLCSLLRLRLRLETYPSEFLSCGKSHARVPRLQPARNLPLRFFNESPYSSPEKKAKGRCVRENVRWTFDQQRVQACTACAGRRMRSIRTSPSWRAK